MAPAPPQCGLQVLSRNRNLRVLNRLKTFSSCSDGIHIWKPSTLWQDRCFMCKKQIYCTISSVSFSPPSLQYFKNLDSWFECSVYFHEITAERTFVLSGNPPVTHGSVSNTPLPCEWVKKPSFPYTYWPEYVCMLPGNLWWQTQEIRATAIIDNAMNIQIWEEVKQERPGALRAFSGCRSSSRFRHRAESRHSTWEGFRSNAQPCHPLTLEHREEQASSLLRTR